MVDYRVALGDVLSVDYAVENQGETVGDQDIELLVASTQEDSDTGVVVDVGVTETGTLEWDTTGATAQEYTVSVESADTSGQFTLEVVDPTDTAFYLVDIDSTNSPILDKNTLDVTATIENVGDQSGTQDITLDIDGTQEDSITGKSLAAGASETVELNWDAPSGSAGDKTATVNSADDFDDVTITVEQGSGFEVTIDSTNEPVVAGDTLTVQATIENTGLSQDTQFITLDIDSGIGVVDNTDVTLAPDSAKTVVLEWDTPGDSGGIDYTATVSSLDDSASTTVFVEVNPGESSGLTNQVWVNTSGEAGNMEATDKVYTTVSNRIHAYSTSDGSNVWDNSMNEDIITLGVGDAVYTGAFSNLVEPHQRTDKDSGATDWNQTLNGQAQKLDPSAYLVTFEEFDDEDTVYGYERATGDQLFSIGAFDDFIHNMVHDDNKIFYVDDGGGDTKLYAYEVNEVEDQDGNITYDIVELFGAVSIINSAIASGMSILDNSLVIRTSEGKVVTFSTSDGSKGWEYTPGTVLDNLTVSNGVAFVNSGSTIYAVEDGSLVWQETIDFTPSVISAISSSLFAGNSDQVARYDFSF